MSYLILGYSFFHETQFPYTDYFKFLYVCHSVMAVTYFMLTYSNRNGLCHPNAFLGLSCAWGIWSLWCNLGQEKSHSGGRGLGMCREGTGWDRMTPFVFAWNPVPVGSFHDYGAAWAPAWLEGEGTWINFSLSHFPVNIYESFHLPPPRKVLWTFKCKHVWLCKSHFLLNFISIFTFVC